MFAAASRLFVFEEDEYKQVVVPGFSIVTILLIFVLSFQHLSFYEVFPTMFFVQGTFLCNILKVPNILFLPRSFDVAVLSRRLLR